MGPYVASFRLRAAQAHLSVLIVMSVAGTLTCLSLRSLPPPTLLPSFPMPFPLFTTERKAHLITRHWLDNQSTCLLSGVSSNIIKMCQHLFRYLISCLLKDLFQWMTFSTEFLFFYYPSIIRQKRADCCACINTISNLTNIITLVVGSNEDVWLDSKCTRKNVSKGNIH